jgi:hypothetical protein
LVKPFVLNKLSDGHLGRLVAWSRVNVRADRGWVKVEVASLIRRLLEWLQGLGTSGRRPGRPFSAVSQGFGANARAERGVDQAWYLSERERQSEQQLDAPDPRSWEAREERGEVP